MRRNSERLASPETDGQTSVSAEAVLVAEARTQSVERVKGQKKASLMRCFLVDDNGLEPLTFSTSRRHSTS